MIPRHSIPIIDLFAGPGGLGEGFSALGRHEGTPKFDIRLSIEKDPLAHQTLELRAFFRQFPHGRAPDAYYAYLRGERSRDELFIAHPKQAAAAQLETWNAELGLVDLPVLNGRIGRSLNGAENWVLIGGPPCQAYSLAGRSRNKGKLNYSLDNDPKARLYVEYLRIIRDFWPTAFVMENVRGLLSSRIEGELVFDRICQDISDPAKALPSSARGRSHTYSLHALTNGSLFESPSDYVIRAEHYGIPQARHRVIIVGIRDDANAKRLKKLRQMPAPCIRDMIHDLPELRSGLSKEPDSAESWVAAVLEICRRSGISVIDKAVRDRLIEIPQYEHRMLKLKRGTEYLDRKPHLTKYPDWFLDPRHSGVCNHSTRSHIREDLHRYLFAAVFAQIHQRSPQLSHFPKELLPEHENIQYAMKNSSFADRFRVQPGHRHATTITSHISKDGHYYIHYDPKQCRSLTVREAARIQTFPDNYFFNGPRTQQYAQVGNAVPPLLAKQIAESLIEVLL